MRIVSASLKAAAGRGGELGEALRGLVEPTRMEPGAVAYAVQVDVEDPCAWMVHEVYRDPAALEAHMASPHLQAFLSAAGALLAEPPSVRILEMVACFGLQRGSAAP